MGVTATVGAAVLGAATTVYATQQAAKNMPKAPVMPVVPKLPDTNSLAASNKEGDLAAKTAGGTILSDPAKNVGDGTTGAKKTLLGA